MSEFEEAGPTFKLEQRDEIEVYAGQRGHVIIKQTSPMGDEPQTIFVHPDDIAELKEFLEKAYSDAVEIREHLKQKQE